MLMFARKARSDASPGFWSHRLIHTKTSEERIIDHSGRQKHVCLFSLPHFRCLLSRRNVFFYVTSEKQHSWVPIPGELWKQKQSQRSRMETLLHIQKFSVLQSVRFEWHKLKRKVMERKRNTKPLWESACWKAVLQH